MSNKAPTLADLAQLESFHWSRTSIFRALFNSPGQIIITANQCRIVINPDYDDYPKVKRLLEELANDNYAKRLKAQEDYELLQKQKSDFDGNR